MRGLKDRVAIVTGGGRGLGKGLCIRLAEEEVRVIAVDIIDTAGTVKEIESNGGSAIGFHVNVTNEQDAKRMADETIARFGRIDILVNNAAIFYGLEDRPFEEIDPQRWERVMAVQPKGAWLCARAVTPYMKKQGKGKIVNISSNLALTGRAGIMDYVASKGAVIGLTCALAVELGEYNICVNAVAPGSLVTEANLLKRTLEEQEELSKKRQLIPRAIYPQDVAGLVAFLASDDADLITGQTILVDGGWLRH